MFPDDVAHEATTSGRYVCSQCGAPGVLDHGFTQMDGRYATGRCTGVHEGKQFLVRENVMNTPKRRKKRDG